MTTRAGYLTARAAGRCPNCSMPVSGYVYCDRCRDKIRRLQSARRYKARHRSRLVAAGRCMDCRQAKPDVRGKEPRCDACRQVFARVRKAERDRRRAAGKCTECGQEKASGPYHGLGPHCSERHARSIAKLKEQYRGPS